MNAVIGQEKLVKALEGYTLETAPKTILFLGQSGCGKSTSLECLSGLLKPDSGNIYANSRPVLSLQESEAAIFEQSACDDVAFGPRNKGVKGQQLIQTVKNSMDLAGIPFDEFAERIPAFRSFKCCRKRTKRSHFTAGRSVFL